MFSLNFDSEVGEVKTKRRNSPALTQKFLSLRGRNISQNANTFAQGINQY